MNRLGFDLNIDPPPFNDNEPQGGPSMEDGQRRIWVPNIPNYGVRSHRDLDYEPQGQMNVLDVDLNEDYDDVADWQFNMFDFGPIVDYDDLFNLISSTMAFEQASSSQTTQGRTSLIDSESVQIADDHQRNVRRVESQPRVNICDLNLPLEGTESFMPKPGAPLPPATPQPPTFQCPVCMEPLVKPMATSCGHMFCEGCIKAAIAVEAKCPICRRKVAHQELRRIYFS